MNNSQMDLNTLHSYSTVVNRLVDGLGKEIASSKKTREMIVRERKGQMVIKLEDKRQRLFVRQLKEAILDWNTRRSTYISVLRKQSPDTDLSMDTNLFKDSLINEITERVSYEELMTKLDACLL
jgi:hypothetical protein